jgi:hypothetical protein
MKLLATPTALSHLEYHCALSTHLRLTKIHLRMLLHEFLQHILFLLVLARRLPLPLHLLVIHHLLHHASCFPVQIAQLRVFRLDFRDVDFWGGGDYVGPPFGFVLFVEVDGDFFAGGCGFERPGAFVREDRVGKVALGSGRLVLYSARYCTQFRGHD